MRPVLRPPWEPGWERLWNADVALGALGRFCSACELPLRQGGIAWDAAADRPASRRPAPALWPQLLVLCEDCAEATLHDVGTPLRPDVDLTFTLDARSPLTYEPRRLTVRAIGSGVHLGATERVVAVGMTLEGAATVRHYALNTPMHDPVRDEVLVPEGMTLGDAEELDPRMALRTQAWSEADTMAERLASVSDSLLDEFLPSLSWIVENTGFWSVWATVLWRRLGASQPVLRLLQPRSHVRRGHPFAATRGDWLPSLEQGGMV
jgi:hypothetical protein